MLEMIDRRVLGAVRLIDRSTGRMVTERVEVTATGATFFRNLAGFYVIDSAPDLEPHTTAFQAPPDQPALGSRPLTITVRDHRGKYLPRLARIALPRDPDPANRDTENSLFRPHDIALYGAPLAPLGTNWSAVRASVRIVRPGASEEPLAGALLRVVRISDEAVLASGLSDRNGEALVRVPGIPITNFADAEDGGGNGSEGRGGPGRNGNDSPVTVSEVAVRLEVSFDAEAQWPVDPDFLEDNHEGSIVATEDLSLRTSRTEQTSIVIQSN